MDIKLNYIRLINIVAIAITIGVAIWFIFKGQSYNSNEDASIRKYEEKKYGFIFEGIPIESTKLYSEELIADIIPIYQSRLKDYKEDQGKLSTIIRLITVILLINLIVLFYKPKSLKIPILGLELPEVLIYLFAIFGAIVIWINFSLLMMSTIDGRMALEYMTDVIESKYTYAINYYYSNSRVLLDQGLTDPWCAYYHLIFQDGMNPDDGVENAKFVLLFVFAPLIGIFLGTSISLATNFIERTKNITAIIILPFLFLSIIGTSCQIYNWFGYSSNFFVSIWITSSCFVVFWYLWGRRFA